jgi:hypothetical protein
MQVRKLVTRWDPSSRAGAVAIKTTNRYDPQAVHEAVMDWADYQNLTGELDNVETSPVTGNYDWRGYLLEESKIAQEREERRTAKAAKKRAAERAPPGPAPHVFYA